MPICTLPTFGKKIYLINAPPLVQSGMRNKLLTLGDHKAEITKSLGQPPEIIQKLMQGTADEDIYKVTIGSLVGENLASLNKMALSYISGFLNEVPAGSPVEIDNFFSWTRDLIGIATTWGLYGKNNPYREREMVHCIWYAHLLLPHCLTCAPTSSIYKQVPKLTLSPPFPLKREYDAGMDLMSYGWLSRKILAPKAIAARTKMDSAQRAFYRAEHDRSADVSALIRGRAQFWRDFGFDNDGISRVDMVPFASTTNTAPTFFWVLAEVFSDPARVARIRAEIEAAGAAVLQVREEETNGKRRRVGAIDFMAATRHCPYAVACYREVLRVYDNATGSRTVVGEDTSVTDPATGREYLLRKGVQVQWSACVTHAGPQWGPADPDRYEPERWLDAPLEENKDRRDAFIPFGGGKHLCPGRNFAFAEIVGSLVCMAVGFDLEGVRVPPDSKLTSFHIALKYPVYKRTSSAVKLVRRPGWEDVEWSFV